MDIFEIGIWFAASIMLAAVLMVTVVMGELNGHIAASVGYIKLVDYICLATVFCFFMGLHGLL